jgi:2'-5' RNA ligase
MPFETGETGVVVAIHAATPVIDGWRQQFDSSAPFGVPPHVTICYPFVPRNLLTPTDIDALAGIVAAQPAFDLRLSTTARFTGEPGVLYLEPDPDGPFRRLTADLLERWPAYPPYGGQFAAPTPHVTVTDLATDHQMAEIEARLRPSLPLRTRAEFADLVVFDGSQWGAEWRLPFGT